MKRPILALIAIALSTLCFGQTDTIFSNNEKISCSIKEITTDAVKYTFTGEDLVNSIYKNSVQKIVFKSGRVQTFAETTSFKKINGIDDFENVTMSQVESEVKGLFKIGDVSSKAKGTTIYSSQGKVKERAYRKLKIIAAMMGANIIYLTNQRTEGTKVGSKYQSGSTAETDLTGIAYTNQLPNIEEFKTLISGKSNFIAVEEAKLGTNAMDMEKKDIKSNFNINNVTNESGLIIIKGELQGAPKDIVFRVVTFDKDYFNIYYEIKSTSYNIKLKI